MLVGTISGPGALSGSVSAAGTLAGALSMAPPLEPERYEGPYEVTPAESAQRLATGGLMMTGDVTVAAIPSNYGLITWDGAALTVS